MEDTKVENTKVEDTKVEATKVNDIENTKVEDIKIMLYKHQKINNYIYPKNIIFFNLPIILKYREFKGYKDQIFESTEDVLNSTEWNELFIPHLKLKITQGNVYTENDLNHEIEYDIKHYRISSFNEIYLNLKMFNFDIKDAEKQGIAIYKHFVEDDDESIPEEIIDSHKKIAGFENQILCLKNSIALEKDKILKTDYVKNKLNTKVKDLDLYIKMLKVLDNEMLKVLDIEMF